MIINFKKAQDFVYSNGTLAERALFAYLFEDGTLEHLHQCLACYRNPDGGWGHGLEHDIKTPDSHPLALEYILSVMVRDLQIPTGTLFDAAANWLEDNRSLDGSLENPASIADYPHAPWWNGEEGAVGLGQTMPDAIVGNLNKIGKASLSLIESTKKWVQENLTIEHIQAVDWLFMNYHAYDYFMNIDDFPNLKAHRQAVIDNIKDCAEKAPEKQYPTLFQFANMPDSPITQALPDSLIKRHLDYLIQAQRDDGAWTDEHNLPQWQTYMTIFALHVLHNYEAITL